MNHPSIKKAFCFIVFLLTLSKVFSQDIVSPIIVTCNVTLVDNTRLKLNNYHDYSKLNLNEVKSIYLLKSIGSDERVDPDILNLIFNKSPNLDSVSLFFNIESLPEITIKNSKITYVDLSKNKLASLPSSFHNLKNLKILNLDYNNTLSNLPDSFGLLTNLTEFSIVGTHFNTFPNQVFKLRNLEKLSIAGINSFKEQNRFLTELPDSFENLSNLKNLVIDNTLLTKLPNSINKLTKLTNFSLNSGEFNDFPTILANLPSLEYLSFIGNPVNPNAFVKSIKLIKWSGLLFINDSKLSEKQYLEIQKSLKKIDVYFD